MAKYDSVYHLGKTEKAVEALWYKTRDQLDVHAAGGIVGGDEWTDIFLYAGYYQLTWLDLADTFVAWVKHHNQAKVIAEFRSSDGPGNDNGFAVYNAVQCTDVQWPQKWSTWQKDNDRVNKIAPFETWGNAWFNAPCLYWPAKAGTPVKVDGTHVKPALLIDETLDAATPYPGSLEVRKLYPSSVLLARAGRHHARRHAVRQRVRRRHDRGVPRGRHAADPQAGQPGGRDLRPAAGPGPGSRRGGGVVGGIGSEHGVEAPVGGARQAQAGGGPAVARRLRPRRPGDQLRTSPGAQPVRPV